MLGPQEAIVIIASPETNADLFWATRFWAPDPIIFVQTGQDKIVLVNPLEFSRAKKEILGARVLSEWNYYKRGNDLLKNEESVTYITIVLHGILEELGVKTLNVQYEHFPYSHGKDLEKLGYTINPVASFLYERSIKTPQEISYIEEISRYTDEAISQAVEILKQAKINSAGFLALDETIVTSELLKQIVTDHLWKYNCLGAHTIISSGIDSYEPHNEGHGPIKAHTPIVMDVFPRSLTNGYFTDTTRTFCKGKANKKLSRMFRAVLDAQQAAIDILKPGLPAKETNVIAVAKLEEAGFQNKMLQGGPQGFIHGLGHGVGVEIHEKPSLNGSTQDILEKNNIVTVEPGLYYPRVGGVRIEDTLVITENGYRSLTNSPKERLEIA